MTKRLLVARWQKAVRRSQLPAMAKQVGINLSTYMDYETGVVPDRYCPSIETQMADTGRSRDSVCRGHKELVAAEFLELRSGGGSRIRNRYAALFPEGSEQSDEQTDENG